MALAAFVPTAAITMDGASAALLAGQQFLAALPATTGPDVEVGMSLANLKGSDSAALAVLFAWQRQATSRGYQLRFSDIPDALGSFATLYGVDVLLPGFDPPAAANNTLPAGH